jgi:hypothetical protein
VNFLGLAYRREWHPQEVVQAIGFTIFFEIPHCAVDSRLLPFIQFRFLRPVNRFCTLYIVPYHYFGENFLFNNLTRAYWHVICPLVKPVAP